MSEPVITAPQQTVPAPEGEPQGDPEAKETDWKAEARKWETRAKENHQKLKEAEPKLREYDAWAEASKTETQRLQEEIARERDARVQWQTRAVSSRVETLAADRFADPSDALGQLDPGTYLGAGGDIDEARITADLDALLERKPHWRKPEPGSPAPRVPAPNPAQGSGGKAVSADPAETFAALIRGRLTGSQ